MLNFFSGMCTAIIVLYLVMIQNCIKIGGYYTCVIKSAF